jgi:hypothetical protein
VTRTRDGATWRGVRVIGGNRLLVVGFGVGARDARPGVNVTRKRLDSRS